MSNESVRDHLAYLTEVVTIAEQRLEVIADILEKIQDDIRWALENDRAIVLPVPEGSVKEARENKQPELFA